MGRPRKLDKDAERHIRLRVRIAKETRLISQRAVAVGFEVSIVTLRRYYLPKERRASQEHSLERYERQKLTRTSRCDDCSQPIADHRRCDACNILIHDDPKICRCGAQHGLAYDAKRCRNCFGMLARATFSL